MVLIRDGQASSRKGRGERAILGITRSTEIAQQGSAEPNHFSENLDNLQLWEADLWVSYRRFRHLRQQSGLFGEKQLKLRDADGALARALRIARSDAQNSLATYRRDGGK